MGPGTRYVATNGEVTDIKSHAAKFSTPAAAFDFAKEIGVNLSESNKYVGQENFTDFEIQTGEH